MEGIFCELPKTESISRYVLLLGFLRSAFPQAVLCSVNKLHRSYEGSDSCPSFTATGRSPPLTAYYLPVIPSPNIPCSRIIALTAKSA